MAAIINEPGRNAFRFPYDRYGEEVAIYANFRYLQNYLQRLSATGITAATIVFATSATENPDRADIQCDGTADQVQINDAIAKLAGNDMRLVFLEGTYDIAGDIDLLGRVTMEGPGIFNMTAGTQVASTGTNLIINGMSFTGGGSGDEVIKMVDDGNALFVVKNCRFYSLTAKAVIRPWHNSTTGSLNVVVSGNIFDDITISGGGGGSPNGVIWADDASAQERYYHVISNTFQNVTGAIIDTNGTQQAILVTNNTLLSSTGKREGTWSHNWINGSYDAGDHTNVDHGTLAGLTDDDHTQYVLDNILTTAGDIFYATGASTPVRLAIGTGLQLLRTNSGATAPEWATPAGLDTTAIHDNVASEISAITVKGTPVGADFMVIEDSAAANVKKHMLISGLEAILDHGSIAGLSDDDHTQYMLDSIVTTAGDIIFATGSSTPVRLAIGTANQVLAVNSGATAPEWVAATSTDADAIHDNVASEISAITNKATPAGGDFLVIEDSAATNAKKHITVTNLEAILDHGTIAGLGDDDHTQYLLVDGSRDMTGVLTSVAGTALLPGIDFVGDPNTGIYLAAADHVGIVTAGVERMVVRSGGQISATGDGTAGAPSWTWGGDLNTGIYLTAVDSIGFATAGSERMVVRSGGQISATAGGSISAPSWSFGSDLNTGMYNISANKLGFTAGGTEIVRIDTVGIYSTVHATTGSAANCELRSSDGLLLRSTASARRYKKHISDMPIDLSRFNELQPRQFQYKDFHFKDNSWFWGLVAEEVEDIYPLMVDHEEVTGEVENVRYANLVVPVIAKVQELNSRVEQLEAEMAILEGEK